MTEDLATVHELTPFEDLLDVLESLARNHALAFRLEVGRVLLNAFFGGDGAAYQSHDSTKDARFALFFAHCRDDLDKLGIGESTARNCIKARLVYDLLPAQLQAALFFSQVVELTRVPDPTARTRLAVAAVQGDWTVRQLRDAVGHVLAGGEIDGDPSAPGIQPPAEDPADDGPRPQAGRLVTVAEKWSAQVDAWTGRWAKVDPAKVRGPQRKRLRAALAQLRGKIEALEGALGD